MALDHDKERLTMTNKEFRELYFKLVKQYLVAKEQHSALRKSSDGK
jgi:hypothetical protein